MVDQKEDTHAAMAGFLFVWAFEFGILVYFGRLFLAN